MRPSPFALLLVPGLVGLAAACSQSTEPSPEQPIIVVEDPVPDASDPSTLPDAGVDPDPDATAETGRVDGEACESDANCRSGFCAPDPDWPGGYCTTVDCNTREDCQSDGQNNACLLPGRGSNFCVRLCTSNDECREGYVCQGLSQTEGYCAPNPAPPFDGPGDDFPFEVSCTPSPEGRASLAFDVSDDLHSYTVVPFVSSGRRLFPSSVTSDLDGTSFNLRQENGFQSTGAQLFGFINPTIFPAVPDDIGKIREGAHTYRLGTDDSEVCHYLLERPTRGTEIDLNIYLVGLSYLGLNANTAANHDDLQDILATVESIYNQADVSLGQVRYFSVPEDAEEAYSVVRSESDVARLAMLTEAPGTDADSMLSANLILVQNFDFTDSAGTLGISMGIPGAPALHGSGISGVALTGEYIGRGGSRFDGNAFTANIIAHELGHFLGLFHTTETTMRHFDPLDDTPRCTEGFPESCPDLGNLMFPLADPGNFTVTADQAHVIGVNPLVK